MYNHRFLLLVGICLLSGYWFTPVKAQAPDPSAGPILTIQMAESGYDRANSLAISPDGKLLVVGSSLGIYFYNFQTGQEIRFISTETWVRSLAFSSDGESIVTGSYDNIIRLWNVSDGKLLREYKGHTAWVQAVALSPDGELLASASDDSTVRLWRVSDGAVLNILTKDTSGIRALTFSPDSTILATGGFDKIVRLLNVSDGTLLRQMEGHTDWVRCLVFSQDGKTLASGGFDTIARQWRVEDGKLLSELKGHTSSVLSIAYSPDGKTLATGSVDTTLRIWRASDGLPLRILTGHRDFVFSAAFSPDGKILASGAVDNSVRLWDVQGLEDLQPLDEVPPTPSENASRNCAACHHPLGYFTQPDGINAPPRVLEVGCSTCHQGGVVVLNWCPQFVRKFDGLSVEVAPPVSSDKVGVPQGNRNLGVVISTVGNSEHFKSAPIITAVPIGGKVYYAGGDASDVLVTLDIWSETKQVSTLTTKPNADGTFSFNVNVGSDENELDVPIEQRTCIYCHSDTNKKQPYIPAGEVHLSVKAQAPDGIQATDERWIVVDRSQLIPAIVRVVDEKSGEPVAGIIVQAGTRLYKWQARQFASKSDSNGQAVLHIESLSETTTIYQIQAAPTLVNGVMYEGVEPVQVDLPSGVLSTPEITLKVKIRNGKISGKINGFEGGVLPAALRVWAVRDPDGMTYSTPVAANGTYVFDDIPVDKYLITADRDELALQGFVLKSKKIDLHTANLESVDLDLENLDGEVLQGTIRAGNFQKLPFAWVSADQTGTIVNVMPESGNYLLSNLLSEKQIITASAPGYYNLAQVTHLNPKQVDELDFTLVKRPETRNLAWGDGSITVPPESMVTVDGERLVFEQGWLWGSAGQAPHLLVDHGQTRIEISSGEFAIKSLPNDETWLYIFNGQANISAPGYAEQVFIGSGQMVALIENRKPVPLDINSVVSSTISTDGDEPLIAIWQPEFKAILRDNLARFGVSVAEAITFTTYLLITIAFFLLPLVGVYVYLKRRRA